MMQPDDELCLCFHVTRRKVENYLRIERPRRVAQLADCYGAGTGCGWCRPFLEKLFAAAQQAELAQADDAQPDGPEPPVAAELPDAAAYAAGRSTYVQDGRGTPPPGAAPVEPR